MKGHSGEAMGNAFHSSRDVILRTSQWVQARHFYEKVLGFQVTNETDAMLRVETGAIRFFIERGAPHGPVFDFLVRDVESAKAALIAAGCLLVEEDPSIPRCYLQDPFGLVFNLGLSATPDA
jgi:catechol 2,3-dioxygenase-like lactoylglutathione lyase family enzyme